MRIVEKINMEKEDLIKEGPITIVAFGDSVTHGGVSCGINNYETVYWNRLRQKINQVRSYVPVNVINAGIGGTTAAESLGRMELQVFAHRPDLVIVCFGLNDVNAPLEEFLSALETIFDRCIQHGAETIFMTPNMLNTYVAEDTAESVREYAAVTAQMQNSGRMDQFMEAACKLATSKEIAVCDCYAKWKELSKTQDTTLLLANRINHPSPEMHELFADSLFRMIFEDMPETIKENSSTMWEGK